MRSNKFRGTVAALLALSTVAGCATQPEKIATRSVSPILYKDLTCDQIALELHRVQSREGELHTSLKKTADTDEAQMAIGLILLWPVLFGLEGGDGAEASEYGRIKGEREALNYVALQKKCTVIPPPPAIHPAEKEPEQTKL